MIVHFQTEIDLTVLEGTLQSVDTIVANPVTSIDIDQSKLSPTVRQINEERRLPLSIRESSILYQFSRTLIYRRLLSGYPHTLERIIEEAKLGFFLIMNFNYQTVAFNLSKNFRCLSSAAFILSRNKNPKTD